MSRQSTAWTLTLVLLVAALAIGVAGTAWWNKLPHATVVQQDDGRTTIIRTNASQEVLYAAIREATDPYHSYTVQSDGTTSDPTYRASSNVVRGGNGTDVGQRMTSETATGSIEFRDRSGNLIEIDTVEATGELTRISITYAPPGDLSSLTQDVVRCLRNRGVRVR